jgi:NADH:ubiquinone oxidoreductase subunit E
LTKIELAEYLKKEREHSVSDTELDLVKHLDTVNKVVGEYLKGNDPTKISKELDIPRTKVVSLIKEWQVVASDNSAIRARAKEALAAADEHYSRLISKAYEVIDEATTTADLRSKSGGIKLVMDLESKRIEMLQKAGLLENKELAEEMLEIERRQQILMTILKEIAAEHPEIRDKVMSRLSDASKKLNETVTIVQDVR